MGGDTICALATPRGQGAVGMIRVSGPQALPLLKAICLLRDAEPRKMKAVRLRDPESGEILDRALVCFLPGPRSFTGEDVVEIFGHGGVLNMERIVSLLVELGARRAKEGEFSSRAVINGRMDLCQAEGMAEIIGARSVQALRNAQAILDGELGLRVQKIKENVCEISARLEACVDFCEEIADERLHPEEQIVGLELAEACVSKLASTYEKGRFLDGVRVSLVGQVNAGKSSLFNCLLGYQRALVSHEPGTTRDYIEAEAYWDGSRVLLVDTAGKRLLGPCSAVEEAGKRLAEPIINQSDLLLHVVDLTDLEQRSGKLVVQHLLHRPDDPLLVAGHKLDLTGTAALDELRESLPAGAVVVGSSAISGQGVDELRAAITKKAVVDGLQEEGICVTRERHHEALLRAQRALSSGRRALSQNMPPEMVTEHCREALQALGEITGETCSEAVLDVVFRSFCLGK